MPSQKNRDQLQVINDKLSAAKNIIFADYQGINVSDQTKLRRQIVENGGEFTVQKNNLLKIALKKRLDGLPHSIKDALQGPTAVLYSYEDVVTATKALVEFSKDNDSLKIKIGLLAGTSDNPDTILTVDEIKNLATLPSRDQLRAQVVSQLNAPIQGFANVLSGNLRSLIQVLVAMGDQKQAN